MHYSTCYKIGLIDLIIKGFQQLFVLLCDLTKSNIGGSQAGWAFSDSLLFAVCVVLCFCGRPPGNALCVPMEEILELPKVLLFLVTFGFFLLASWRKKSDGVPKEGSEDSKSVHGPFSASPTFHRNSE